MRLNPNIALSTKTWGGKRNIITCGSERIRGGNAVTVDFMLVPVLVLPLSVMDQRQTLVQITSIYHAHTLTRTARQRPTHTNRQTILHMQTFFQAF